MPIAIDPDMPVDEIMRRWPPTIKVMIRYGMLCVGCPIGTFHTVTDACAAHGIDEDAFSGEILAAMRSHDAASGESAFLVGIDAARVPGLPAGTTSACGSPPEASAHADRQR